MADNGKISYSVGIENSKLRSDAAESKRILQTIGTTAVEEGQKMDTAFKKVGMAMAGAMSAAAAMSFAKQIISVRAEIQSLEISFRTLLGSKDKADAMFNEIREFAVKTPMMLKDLAGGAQTMLGFGIAADEVMPILKAIGDVSMGDSQKFQSLTLAFSQATAAGKLMGGDLLQMINAGFNPLAIIAEKTGKNIGELKEEMSKGAISADMLKQAFIDATSEGGKFYGMLEAQSKGINGAISNLYGAIDDMFDDIGGKLEDVFVTGTELATTLVQHYEEIAKVLLVVISTYGAYKAALIAVAAYQKGLAIWGSVQAFLSLAKSIRSAKDAMLLLNMATKANPIGLLLGVIAAAASAFALFGDSTDEAAEALKREQDEIEEFNKAVGASAGKAQSEYKKLQKEYNACKNTHEKREWIQKSKTKFNELGIAVNSVNTAENVFVKNTAIMMEAFKKRAEAAAWQGKIDDAYARRVELQLEQEKKRNEYFAIVAANEKVRGQAGHDASSGDEYIGNDGNWYYTEQGANKRRQIFVQAQKDALAEFDKEIEQYTSNMERVTSEFQDLMKKAGTAPKTNLTDEQKKELQKLEDEQAKRNQKLLQNAETEKEIQARLELEKRQAKIDAMQEGFDKEMAQNKLNYDKMMAENEKREREMLDKLKEKKLLEWQNKNPKATTKQELDYVNSLNTMGRKDLQPEQIAQLKAFDKIAADLFEKSNQDTLDRMLADVLTYEQKRDKIARDYAEKREQLYDHDENGKRNGLKAGVTRGNVDEMDRQEKNALEAVDEEFASREETYQSWLDSISDMSLQKLQEVLQKAEEELKAMEKDGRGGQDLATARAKVKQTRAAIAKANAKDSKEAGPSKRTLKDWKELHDVLQEGVKGFEELGDAIGGTAGELMKSAGEIASGTLSMINGIMTLTKSSATAMEGTAEAGAAAMSSVEKASVILAVISAALQVATAIAGLFNHDDEKQEEIERLQGRIDQLQWELDNKEVVLLRDNTISGLQLVKNTLYETRMELLQEGIAANNLRKAFSSFTKNVADNQELLQRTAQSIADTYANIEYTANKALGRDKYKQAREDLENIAQQQILLQEQIRNEQGKKDVNHDAIKDWENQIEELGNQAVEIINEIVEDIIGGTSTDIANELSDAFIDAFQNGEDAAEAWGNKVNEIVADVMKRMMVQKFLEEPLGDIFNKYKAKWFTDGNFNGIDAVINSMQGFANDLNSVGEDFAEIWDSLPDSVKNMFTITEDAQREASEKGIATASQESVDELNGRATAIQGHTYSIMESTKLLVSNTNAILDSVMNIDRNTDSIDNRIERMEGNVRELKDTMNDIALKGIKMK